MEEVMEEIGKVIHYFSKINVAVIELTGPVSKGDTIFFKGITTDFKQNIESMQIEHEDIEKAEAGQSIGLKVIDRVREGDIVYKTS